MIFSDVMKAVNIQGYEDDPDYPAGQYDIIRDALEAINATPTGGQMLEAYILANQTYPSEKVIDIVYNSNSAFSLIGLGRVILDPDYVNQLVYINRSGVAVQSTVVDVLAHELVHALEGLTDEWSGDPDYSGDTVTYANQIFTELGIDEQLSYPGANFSSRLEIGRDYSLGNEIDRAYTSNPDHSAVGFFRDLMIGNEEANEFSSGSSNDIIYGEAGADILRGGQGDDTIFGGTGNDAIEGGNDDDVIYGGTGGDSIDGGAGNDTINGETGNDSINAGIGNDVVFGGDDNDTINGGTGDDSLAGDDGNDFIEGGTGTDTIYGGSGDDTINAGTGDDIVYGGSDNDTINGSEGNDVLSGGSGADVIDGGSDSDIVRFTGATGGITAEFTSGGNGSGTGGDASGDTYTNIEGIIGTANNDTFTATSGGVVLAGGDGIDTFNITYQSSGTPYVIWGGDGVDIYNLDLGGADPESEFTVLGILGVNVTNLTEHNFHLFSLDNNALYGNIPREHVDVIVLNPDDNESVAGWTFFGTQNDYPTITLPDVFGTSGNDNLVGSSANNVISAGAGNDYVNSGAGNDIIIYTSGNDTIAGFTQNYGFDTVDLSNYAAGGVSFRISGVDIIATTADGEITLANQVSYDIGHERSNIEEIMLSDGTLDDAGIRARAVADQSTSGDDVITATNFTDIISSGSGNDTITAGSGDDTIVYTSGDDVIVGNKVNRGFDILDLSNYAAADVGFRLSGDHVFITTPDGVIQLQNQVQHELGDLNSNIEQIIFSDGTLDEAGIRTRGLADQITSGDDSVTGSGLNDTISSGAGNDTITANGGDDTITYTSGNDVITGNAGNHGFDTLDLSIYAAADVTFRSDGTHIYVTTPDGEITLEYQLLYGIGDPRTNIERVIFSDGTLDEAGIITQTTLISGTSGDDALTGTGLDDLISSGAGNDSINAGAGDDTIIYTSGNDTIVGFTQNYGTDTLDLSNYAAADVSFTVSGIDVLITTPDGLITLANQVSYDVGHQRSNIEQIIFSDGTLDDAGIRARAVAEQGTSGDDVISATKYDDVISGGAGNDTITAREGDDTIVYTSGDDVIVGNKWNRGFDTLDLSNYTAADVSFSITGDHVFITTPDGVITLQSQVQHELGDLNSNIEQIIFSDGTLDDAGIRDRAVVDQGTGDGIVTGTAANDTINASFVDADGDTINTLGQTINAGAGDDLIYDGAGDDFVFGGDGNDRFYSGMGADAFNGGAGSDRVFYTGSDVGVTIDLTDTSQNTGLAQGDSYIGISQIDGSNHNDTIIMEGSVQKADGGAGDDTLVDMFGATHLWGGSGADTFELHIGSGTSNIRDFSGASAQGDHIDLTGWNVDAIDAANFSIERRFGSTSSNYDIDAILIVTDGQGSELDRTVVNGVIWDAAGDHSLTIDDFMFV